MSAPIHVAVTGAAGNIGYATLFRLASGEIFGPHRPVCLHLIEVPPVMSALDGIHMELDDCAFPTLAGVQKHDSDHLEEAFRDCNFILLVGSIAVLTNLVPLRMLSLGERIDLGAMLFIAPVLALVLGIMFEATRIAMTRDVLPEPRRQQVVRN